MATSDFTLKSVNFMLNLHVYQVFDEMPEYNLEHILSVFFIFLVNMIDFRFLFSISLMSIFINKDMVIVLILIVFNHSLSSSFIEHFGLII